MLVQLLPLLFFIEPVYSCDSVDKTYKIGDDVKVCIILSEFNFTANATSVPYYLAFEPKLDEYSAVRLKGSYNAIHDKECANDTNTTYTQCEMSYAIQARAGKLVDTVMIPYLKDKLVAIVSSVVVTLEDGKVTDIEWDNDCDLCDEECLKYEDEEICAEKQCDEGKEGDCDPRVYISWIGTDNEGNNLLSAAYRMSQFRKYSLYKS